MSTMFFKNFILFRLLVDALVFLTGQGAKAASDDYFTTFITGYADPIVYNIIFLLMTAAIIFLGVNKGIESLSKILMPILFVMIIGIAIYSLTLKGSEETGGRTGIEGFGYYTIPNLDSVLNKEGFRSAIIDVINKGEYHSLLLQYPLDLTNVTDYSVLHSTYHIDFFTYIFTYIGSINYGALAMIIMDAMGQLFYSISVAMGIMVTYGSYFKDKDNLVKAVTRIDIFDTIVAFLAGVMIIPAVYVFLGTEGLDNAGPGLLFVAMPKIFAQMGLTGSILGGVFFLTVLFAALTSCISIMEAICSGMIDKGLSLGKATFLEGGIALVLSTVVCLGYNALYFEFKLPNGSTGQLLDIMDYLSNNVLMPLLAIGTCILIGWVVKPKIVIDEATKNGEMFRRRHLYTVMVKYIAPALLIILLLGSLGVY